MKKNIINTERRNTLTSLAASISGLAKNLLGGKGIAETELLANWREIAGEELAKNSLPQKISFSADSRNNGTLTLLAANGAAALEIQHKTTLLIDKINTYFGYAAVGKIRVVQNDAFLHTGTAANFEDKNEKKLVTQKEQTYISHITQDIQNPELKARLRSLGESIAKSQK